MVKTRHVTLTTTDEVVVLTPPRNRKVVINSVEVYNTGTSDVKLTLKQVSPDGSLVRSLTVIPVAAGGSHIVNDTAVYGLERGWALKAQLDTASTVELTITYRLE